MKWKLSRIFFNFHLNKFNVWCNFWVKMTNFIWFYMFFIWESFHSLLSDNFHAWLLRRPNKKDILCNHHAFHARKNSVEIFNASADRQRQFISLDLKQPLRGQLAKNVKAEEEEFKMIFLRIKDWWG